MHTEFWSENLRERTHSEDLGIDGRIILERILREIDWKYVNWIRLAQDRDQWRALVYTIINLRFP
jgi:hypothetical protein